jgi:hypothetical protein
MLRAVVIGALVAGNLQKQKDVVAWSIVVLQDHGLSGEKTGVHVDSIVDLLKKIAGEEKGRKKKKRNIFHGQNSTEGSVKNGLEPGKGISEAVEMA